MNTHFVTLGNFDGVHRGHQRMLTQLVDQAKAQGKTSMVIVFEPQPQEFFSKTPPARLTTFEEKCAIFEELGVDCVFPLVFDEEMAALSAEDFVKNILVDTLHIGHILVGDDFRFGRERQGDLALLQQLGTQYGFTSEGLGSIIDGSERISSTAIRAALKEGDFEHANRLLGRPYSMRGVVQQGDQRGRLLGFPTANIDPNRRVLPLSGVFAVKVHGLGATSVFGMANLGTRPTVDGLKTLLEVNLFDFDRTIYGQPIEVEFCHKIRNEQRFESLDALKAQISTDKTAVESYFHHGRL